MKYLNKFVSALFVATLGIMTLASCEGADLYKINAPDWLSEKNAQEDEPEEEEELVGMMEDVYTIGATDFSTGWWQQWSKYYVIPEATKWNAQLTLNINANASNTYKNFAMIISNDVDRGGDGYTEYGAIRFDHQPSGNSEWGDYINRDLVESNLTFGSDTDKGVEKLGGLVTLTVDRTEGGLFVKITNGTVTKTYKQTEALVNLNADASNTNIRVFLVPEGSYIDWISTNIEPIGGCTSAEDKQPLSMTLSGVPTEVLVGTDLAEAMANVTATIEFEEGVTKTATAEELQFEAIPNYNEVGQKTLVVIYNKTFKGLNANKPILATKTFSVVNQLSAFTQTVVVPTPLVLGAEDNSTGWWGAHTENIKIEPKETKVTTFTNYTSGVANWNNFVIVLCKADNSEYAVVRADNFGWGDGYAGCTTIGGFADDEGWTAWRAAMNGAKVTTYVTNNGDGSGDVKAVMVGNDGNTYVQEYKGIKIADPDNFYFRFTVDGCHLVFDKELGAADCSTGWWGAHSTNIQVVAHQVCTVNFTNYTSGVANWNNFVAVLCKADNTEYAVVRADNYGWGAGYGACTATCNNGGDWAAWLSVMNGAKVSVKIANNGDGTADVKATIIGTDGNTYTQDYIGINTIDPDDFYFRFTVDSSHLVFE
jgi:hypothetical protein